MGKSNYLLLFLKLDFFFFLLIGSSLVLSPFNRRLIGKNVCCLSVICLQYIYIFIWEEQKEEMQDGGREGGVTDEKSNEPETPQTFLSQGIKAS